MQGGKKNSDNLLLEGLITSNWPILRFFLRKLMNGIADAYAWLSGSSGKGLAPVCVISLNLVLINTRHGNMRIPEKATGVLPEALLSIALFPLTALNKLDFCSFRIVMVSLTLIREPPYT